MWEVVGISPASNLPSVRRRDEHGAGAGGEASTAQTVGTRLLPPWQSSKREDSPSRKPTYTREETGEQRMSPVNFQPSYISRCLVQSNCSLLPSLLSRSPKLRPPSLISSPSSGSRPIQPLPQLHQSDQLVHDDLHRLLHEEFQQ